MSSRHLGLAMVIALAVGWLSAADALAALGGPLWRQRHTDRAPAVSAAQSGANVQVRSQGYPTSRSGWNASNTWYNVPSYGNYAPPPYATSRSAFYQVGPVPAFGGVRSLPGWGGAR
jgi:hypothetical protein